MSKTTSDKADFSQFRYEKPSSERQNEYDYIPFLSKKINGVGRRLLRHNLDFEKVLCIIYENQPLYDLMSDWKYEGWEITPQAYYHYYRDALGLAPLSSEKLVLFPNNRENETFITVVETASRKLGYSRVDVFWGHHCKTLMEIFNEMATKNCTAEEMEERILATIPPFSKN